MQDRGERAGQRGSLTIYGGAGVRRDENPLHSPCVALYKYGLQLGRSLEPDNPEPGSGRFRSSLGAIASSPWDLVSDRGREIMQGAAAYECG